ncbi:MAG: M23 family metallopeptidase [Clostridiaceae bacterium]|nr:M23 family metallopeptidase [Clostridiaceae bacterium]
MFCISLVVLCIGVGACTDIPTSGDFNSLPPITSTTQNTPSPTHDIINYEQVSDAFEKALKSELILLNNWSMDLGYDEAASIIRSVNRYVLKYKLLEGLLEDATEAAYENAKAQLNVSNLTLHTEIYFPNWQYLASVLPNIKDADELMHVLSPEFELSSNDEKYSLTVKVYPLSILEYANYYAESVSFEKSSNAYLDVRFTYGYLKAVYDENGKFALKESHDYSSAYLDTLGFPLMSVSDFNDTWGQGRSNNTRMHMGTDIKEEEGTKILSCSAGQVVAVGTAAIPGNYVVVIDEFGYEFHYYHLVEPTTYVSVGDTVAKGDILGEVGNTGNSDTNHLHLTVASPEGEFINPYDLLVYLAEKSE